MFIHSPSTRSARSLFSGAVLAAITLLATCGAKAQTVSADFASRSGATPVIPSGLLQVGGIGSSLSNSTGISTLTGAGLNQTRFWVNLNQIYATSTANFSSLDSSLNRMKAAGIHPLAVMFGTPKSLGAKVCTPPSNTTKWGQMAAAVVAHADKYYPNVIVNYEIWNEPELTASMCGANATANLKAYVAIFEAAASRMHAQAKADGRTIHTGGPTISRVAAAGPTYISALVNNSATAPYVDFVSFHIYLSGLTNIQKHMNWSQLYAMTQASNSGLGYYYRLIEPYVRKGKQPNAANTPIFVSEFNDGWAFAVDCCRNHPTYGSLWNSVAITDFLNVVYSGAKRVPSQLGYFNASGSYFCIMGQWNSTMNCSTAALTPYPQFYAYKLFASSAYLDLQAGGHMAAAVSPQSTTSGLGATAFYTRSADSVVIINPTGTNYGSVTVDMKNLGFSASTATVHLLNAANSKITSKSVGLTTITRGYAAKVAVPAYSTVSISVK